MRQALQWDTLVSIFVVESYDCLLFEAVLFSMRLALA